MLTHPKREITCIVEGIFSDHMKFSPDYANPKSIAFDLYAVDAKVSSRVVAYDPAVIATVRTLRGANVVVIQGLLCDHPDKGRVAGADKEFVVSAIRKVADYYGQPKAA